MSFYYFDGSPAGVRTNILTAMGMDKATSDKLMDDAEKSYPLGRHGTTSEVAGYILFLASDECSWVTGTNFLADGGMINAPTQSVDFSKH